MRNRRISVFAWGVVAGLIVGIVVSGMITAWGRSDTPSLDVARAITTLRQEYNWLEARRQGRIDPTGTPDALCDERSPGALSPHCTKQYLMTSRGNVVSG
jgi:hypothetical protein